MTATLFDLNQHKLYFFFSIYSLFLVPIKKIYKMPLRVFDDVSKHLEVEKK